MQIEHIFDADLQFRPDMAAIVSSDGRDGELIGSGDGVVRGRVSGKLSWTLFEDAHGDFCDVYPAGLIETDDGASIPFDAKGYSIRVGDHEWNSGLVLKFSPSDERYTWLAEAPALVAGEFNDETGQATWRAHGHAVAAGVGGA
jgi:hypothetical protein